MTEAEWLTCHNPGRMLGFLRDKGSDRKLRLFAVACAHHVWGSLRENYQTTVNIAEQYSDGRATRAQLKTARQAVPSLARQGRWTPTLEDPVLGYDTDPADYIARGVTARAGWDAAWETSNAVIVKAARDAAWEAVRNAARNRSGNADPDASRKEAWEAAANLERQKQSDSLRCVFGNPFWLVAVESGWLAWNGGMVPALAQAVYEDYRFDRMPILADALEEAGCTAAPLLAHCREPHEHVRGCSVLDLLLGRA
jgi:hypothetical protein